MNDEERRLTLIQQLTAMGFAVDELPITGHVRAHCHDGPVDVLLIAPEADLEHLVTTAQGIWTGLHE